MNGPKAICLQLASGPTRGPSTTERMRRRAAGQWTRGAGGGRGGRDGRRRPAAALLARKVPSLAGSPNPVVVACRMWHFGWLPTNLQRTSLPSAALAPRDAAACSLFCSLIPLSLSLERVPCFPSLVGVITVTWGVYPPHGARARLRAPKSSKPTKYANRLGALELQKKSIRILEQIEFAH